MDTPDIGEDLLVGAIEIASFLNWKNKDGSWNVRRVYHCAEGALPIHKQQGLGLVARKSALRDHFAKLDERFSETA